MAGSEFDFKSGAIISVGVTLLIFVVTLIIPNEPAGKH
jgi:hypothetical protein